jgi:hypothetical protein
MEESWAETRRRKTRRRRLWIAFGAVALIGADLLISSWPHDSPSERVASAPAYDDDSERSIDTSPFKPAEPASKGSTTIPEGVFDPSSTVPTLPTTTTTAAPPITLPPLATPPAGDLVCAAVDDLYSFVRASNDLRNSPELGPAAADALRSAAAKLEQTGNHAFDAGIELLRQAATQLDGTTDPDAVAAIVNPILFQSTPEIRDASKELTQHVAASCADLAQVHPG